MLNFREVLSIIGIDRSHANAQKLKSDLPQYKSPYSKTKIFKMSDVVNLVEGFEISNYPDNYSTKASA